MQEPQIQTTVPTVEDKTRRRIVEVLADVRESIGDGPELTWAMHERMADALIAAGLTGTAAPAPAPVKTKPKTKPKQAYRFPKRNSATIVLDTVGEWMVGAVLILIAAAALIGPGLYNEIMEDRTLSVLDLNGTEINETPLADLVDLRGNVDTYAGNKDADQTIADKAARILDTAITERINSR